jgi:hypothetical protein
MKLTVTIIADCFAETIDSFLCLSFVRIDLLSSVNLPYNFLVDIDEFKNNSLSALVDRARKYAPEICQYFSYPLIYSPQEF